MDIRIRQIKESDYEAIISVLDEWWGGRQMAAMLLRLFFKHFSETGSPEGGFRGYGFHAGIDHPGADGDILSPKRNPQWRFLMCRCLLAGRLPGSPGWEPRYIVGQDFEGGWEGVKVAFELT